MPLTLPKECLDKLDFMKKSYVFLVVKNNIMDFTVAFFAISTFLVLIPVFTYAYFAEDLKSQERIMNRNDTGVTLLDRKNRPFFFFYRAKKKIYIPFSQIPKNIQQAVIASEDKDFYFHSGFSLKSITRSLLKDIKDGKTLYGGSTITQQLVKNALLNANKNFLRKYQELALSFDIERRFTKNEILTMYLNSVYFGRGAFGIEEAAQSYFGKKAKDLTLAESSFLASLLPAPSKFSPTDKNLKEVKIRQKIVLEKMFQQKYITKQQKIEAEKQKLDFTTQNGELNNIAPHFALVVRDELIEKFGEEQIARSGFRVKTSLDLDWQKYAEEVVKKQVEALLGNNVTNGAAVVIDPPTGELRVLVGSVDWYNNKFGKVNVATSLRQPGSSFKPIVYAAAFEKQLITPATILNDNPTNFGGNYSPKDYDGKFRGPVTARRALANSLNVPAVEVLSKLGVQNAMEMAQRLGITTLKDPSNYGLSLALGSGEVKLIDLTNAYATIANQGIKNPVTTILEIQDKSNQKIYVTPYRSKRVLKPEFAFLVSSILSDNNARAEIFGNTLTISRQAAVKTGTTEDYKDSLTFGYIPNLAIGVWVGNNNGEPMDHVAGSLGAAPIWKELMEKFSEELPFKNFSLPKEIETLTICRPAATPSAVKEFFFKGTEPKESCQ